MMPKPKDCVLHEEITSLDTGFYIWSSGKEEFGYAFAIKTNKEWRASAKASIRNNIVYIISSTYKNVPDNPDFEWQKEFIEFKFVDNKNSCLKLVNKEDSLNSRIIYKAIDYDITEDKYTLDESMDYNYLQIDTLNIETGRMAGKFMATFQRTTNNRPWNLPMVRFFNGEFHCKIIN